MNEIEQLKDKARDIVDNHSVEYKANEFLLKLLNTIDERLVISYDRNKRLLIGGEPILPEKADNLKSEAAFILESETYRIISESLKRDAHERMFINSTSFDDMRSGKVQLHLVDTIHKILTVFKNLHRSA